MLHIFVANPFCLPAQRNDAAFPPIALELAGKCLRRCTAVLWQRGGGEGEKGCVAEEERPWEQAEFGEVLAVRELRTPTDFGFITYAVPEFPTEDAAAIAPVVHMEEQPLCIGGELMVKQEGRVPGAAIEFRGEDFAEEQGRVGLFWNVVSEQFENGVQGGG